MDFQRDTTFPTTMPEMEAEIARLHKVLEQVLVIEDKRSLTATGKLAIIKTLAQDALRPRGKR